MPDRYRVFLRLQRATCFWMLVLAAAGCASYGEVQNTAIDDTSTAGGYSLTDWRETHDRGDVTLVLTFSGGGTRAAAMAYGVLEELRDATFQKNGKSRSVLDEVDLISSVSGGSFTAAFYGLHGDGMFDFFKDEFLQLDMDTPLTRSLVNPLHWVTPKGRTERTIDYYQKNLFHGATYADMIKPGRPLIVINTSDLAYGVRFSFIQEYFDLLCSDLTNFPIARATAASSAVPILFNPVVVRNYDTCGDLVAAWLDDAAEKSARQDPELAMLRKGLKSYADKSQRKYIHFVDGGITDNMGIRAVYDVISLGGGPNRFFKKERARAPRHMVLVSVNASTNPVTDMDGTNKQPSITQSVSAMAGVQLHRYNTATLELVTNRMDVWAKALSTPDHEVKAHFIQVTFEDIDEPKLKLFLNKIPTSFKLTDEQVDTLVDTSRKLLRENAVFQQLLSDLNEHSSADKSGRIE